VNVTIIGAGVVGCAIAHELASRGARVRVVDPRGTGRGASRASAGMLAPHIEGHIPALHHLATRSLALYDGLIERLLATTDQPIEYDRSGTLQVARTADEASSLAGEAQRLSAAGIRHSLLSASETRGLESPHRQLADDVTAGLFIPDHGYVVAAALVDALALAARRHGAEFCAERALAVHAGGNGARVATMDRTIDGDAVVIAAGSWTPEIAARGEWISDPPRPVGAPPVKPIRGQLLQLRTSGRIASRIIWGSGCYLVPWRNGSVLVGATVEDVGYVESATASGVHDLLDAAVALIPALRSATFEEVRVGLRPMTADELPIIGASSTMRHVFYATGHYRNGVLLSPLTARLVADLLLEGRGAPELEVTQPARFGL
jgi:glycine oxidase